MLKLLLPSLLALVSLGFASPVPSTTTTTAVDTNYPLAHNSSLVAHDPNILQHDGYFYLFKGGVHIPFYRAKSLNGPWEDMGTVLDRDSVIPVQNRTRPWAPTVVEKDNTFYCFYALSQRGSPNSAIGVATSTKLEHGQWKDRGLIIATGDGAGILADLSGIKNTNAIDPSVFQDPHTNKWYLNYGSYFSGIWNVPLSDDLLSLEDPQKVDAVKLRADPDNLGIYNEGEGSFMTYRNGWYYLWFSRGKCCNFSKNEDVKPGNEYSIRVGRSKTLRPTKREEDYVDKSGKLLLDGGGYEVYGSNHNDKVYAPGGLGVLTEGKQDVLYFHFLNKSVGLGFEEAYMGWTYLDYDKDDWPVVRDDTKSTQPKPNPNPGPAHSTSSSAPTTKPTDSKTDPKPNPDPNPKKDPPANSKTTTTTVKSEPKSTPTPDKKDPPAKPTTTTTTTSKPGKPEPTPAKPNPQPSQKPEVVVEVWIQTIIIFIQKIFVVGKSQ